MRRRKLHFCDAPPRQRRRAGVTLIEILVVISIIGVLASLLLPAIQSARQAASRVHCQNNLRQIGLAIVAHATAHGQLPGGGARSVAPLDGALGPQPRVIDDQPAKLQHQSWGWAYQILPHLDQTNRWLNPNDQAVRGSHLPLYRCTSRNRDSLLFLGQPVGATDYVGNGCSNCDLTGNPQGQPASWGWGGGAQDGVFVQTLQRTAAGGLAVVQKPMALERITDGLSNTVFVTEKRQLASPTPCNDSLGWVSGYPMKHGPTIYGHDTLFSGQQGPPADDERDASIQCNSQAGSPHGIGGNVLFGDGSVRFMAFGLEADLWRAMLSVNGKEDFDLAAGAIVSD